MDKFDEQLKASKQTYEPKSGFVDATMQRIEGMRHHRRWSVKVWAPAAVGLAVIAVFVVLPLGGHTFTSKNNANTTATTTQTAPSSNATQNSAATNGSASTGTDNASLNSDLNSIQSSMNQESSDQNSSNTALNDSQQEVNVPTS